jgi:pyruvate ferredoxin oxidoreductase alpha subunit
MIDLLNGNDAAAEGARLCRPKVIPTYPVTPMAPVLTRIAKDIADKKLDANLVQLECDQSAIAACAGASLGGARVFTATSSQGLAYMHEHLFYISGLRLPVVMGVVNRSLSAPHCRLADHNDALAQKSTGWIQFFCEDIQEVLDNCIQLYKICEHKDVLLPGMFCYEAYIHSHTLETVEIPEQSLVDGFLGDSKPAWTILDPENPITINPNTSDQYYTEFRYRQSKAMDKSRKIINDVALEFKKIFGRDYKGSIEVWPEDKGEIVIVTMGAMVKTARQVILELREKGKDIKMVKVRAFRPFPSEELQNAMKDAKKVIVIDKNNTPGLGGSLYHELRSSLYGMKRQPIIYSAIAGLGGRDVSIPQIKDLVNRVSRDRDGSLNSGKPLWIGLKKGVR